MIPTSNNTAVSRRNWLAKTAAAAVAVAALPVASAHARSNTAAIPAGTGIFNITDYGAKGDGQTLNTAAIQQAIDTCHQNKGGTVLIPAGVFVTGTLELKSHVTLHIVAQGRLLGSGDGNQYHAATAIPVTGEWTMGDGNVGLLFAANAENITIEGQGTIDGQGAQFRSAVRGTPPPAGISGNKRPHMLLFYQCHNLQVKDITLVNGAYHAVRVCVCSYVKMDGIRIRSRVNHNNDGFHFISCSYVHVTNSDVQCQDDACALFGSNRFVTVQGCSFSTRWSVFRFGGGRSENITVADCIIYETFGCPVKMRCDARSHFENISFSNIVMKDVTGPISIGLGPQKPGQQEIQPGTVKNISFNNIQVTVVKPFPLPECQVNSGYNPGEVFSCIILNGMGKGFIENISFQDVTVTFPGGGTAEQGAVTAVPEIASEYYVIGVPPAYGMYARNVKGLTCNNVVFRLAAADLRPALVFDQVTDAALYGVQVDGNKEAAAPLRFTGTTDILISASRVKYPGIYGFKDLRI